MELVVRAIIALVLAALELLGSVDLDPPQFGSDPAQTQIHDVADAVPIAHGHESAATVFSLLRALDPCGLHDIAAAIRVTGDTADQIMPEESLSACQLRLKRGLSQPSWIFTTRIGVPFLAAHRDAARQEVIDGHSLYRDESTDAHARSCTYTRPMGGEFGISLTVNAPLGEPAAWPCPIAKAYLGASRSLTRLVLWAEKRTEPRFALAGVDPCAGTRDILRRLGVQGTARPEALYQCRIQPDSDSNRGLGAPVTIGFRFTTDPTGLAGAGTGHQPVSVNGVAGTATPDPGGQLCNITLAYDPTVAVQVAGARWAQAISIDAVSCDQAQAVAEIVVNNIGNR